MPDLNQYFRRIFIFPVLLLLLLSSCSPASKVQKRGGYMLAGHSVKADRPEINTDDLLNFAQPRPDRKFLGLLRPGVWVSDMFSGGKDRKVKRWFRTRVGRPPVLLDSALVDNSLHPMRIYLNNKGYFGAKVERDIYFKGSRAFVRYKTQTPEPHRLGKITFDIPDDSLRYFLSRSGNPSLLVSGKQYDAYVIRDERERITRDLKDAGYFGFSREYILFEIDTSVRKGIADVLVRVENVRSKEPAPGLPAEYIPHRRYFINNVFIHTNFAEQVGDTLFHNDTLVWKRKREDTTAGIRPDFHLIYRNKLRVRPEAIARSVMVKPGKPYKQQDINFTYNRIQNMGLSRFVSVNLPPARIPDSLKPSGISLLDCEIRMVRNPVNMFTTEAEATNAGGHVGLGGSFSYQNRNIFRGAETFRLKIRGAMEMEPQYGLRAELPGRLFNSLEAGIESGIDFPHLLTPFRIAMLGAQHRARTTIGFGFNYQDRSYYTRYLTFLSFGYEWSTSNTTRHIFSPVELSSISIERDSLITEYLNSLKDPRYLNQYTDHLVMALKYSYVFNNQNFSGRSNYFYFRGNIESAGNVLNFYSTLVGASRDSDGNFTLLDIRFAQYLRSDIDFRYYRPAGDKRQVVYRAAFGIGVPYGNSNVLPFEKGFFAGGANGLRGWQLRSVGPGEYYSPVKSGFERVGDLWLESNVEYRFPVYSFLSGAAFVDAGNIWLLKENEDFPGGHFNLRNLPSTLALDAGLGFRFDFSFFIFRIDGGLPVYDPGQKTGSRWLRISGFQLADINWNFGIGYPF
jgi:outer membrane protein assembly factor BamA